MTAQGYKILILGGGIAGLATALSLVKFAPLHLQPTIEIYEIRPEPGTIGGAMSLTPNGLRVLDHLGVYSVIKRQQCGITVDAVEIFSIYHCKRLAETSLRGPKNEGVGSPPYKGIRITRAHLVEAFIEVLSQKYNATLHCGKRANDIDETESGVTVSFEDGTIATGDILLGCDGVHSFTRNNHIEPSRRQIYSGVSNAFGIAPLDKDDSVHFQTTALNFARRGLLLTSYYERTKRSGYVGAIVSIADVGSRDGWKAKGGDAVALKEDMMDRFGDSVHPAVQTFIQRADDWFMWPVYMLPHGGRWATNRTMLLGDAAHAMPPQGESTGILLENAVLFARCLLRKQSLNFSIKDAFNAFEHLRRKRIDLAFKESQNVVGTAKDSGKFGHSVKTWVIPVVLWLGRSKREKNFEQDVTTWTLGFDDREVSHSITLPSFSRLWSWNYHMSKSLEVLWYHLRTLWRGRKSNRPKVL